MPWITFLGRLTLLHRKSEAGLLLSLHPGSQYRQEHAVQLMHELIQRILVVVSPLMSRQSQLRPLSARLLRVFPRFRDPVS